MVLILPTNSCFVSLLHLEIVLKDRNKITTSLGRNKWLPIYSVPSNGLKALSEQQERSFRLVPTPPHPSLATP